MYSKPVTCAQGGGRIKLAEPGRGMAVGRTKSGVRNAGGSLTQLLARLEIG